MDDKATLQVGGKEGLPGSGSLGTRAEDLRDPILECHHLAFQGHPMKTNRGSKEVGRSFSSEAMQLIMEG